MVCIVLAFAIQSVAPGGMRFWPCYLMSICWRAFQYLYPPVAVGTGEECPGCLHVPRISSRPEKMTGIGKRLQGRLQEGTAPAVRFDDGGRAETGARDDRTNASRKTRRRLKVAELGRELLFPRHLYLSLVTPGAASAASMTRRYCNLHPTPRMAVIGEDLAEYKRRLSGGRNPFFADNY